MDSGILQQKIRIFWILALAGCIFGTQMMLKGTIRSYEEDSLSFNPDINRIKFQTTFPAVSICEQYEYSGTVKKINEFYPGLLDQYDYDYKRMIADQCFGDTLCSLCNLGCESPINCSINFKEMAQLVHRGCQELIRDCMWMNETFNCCKYFLPVDTNYGTCFSFNTLQSRSSGSVPLFQSNITTGPGAISFSIQKAVKVYVHGSEEIPWDQAEPEMVFEADDHVKFYFRLVEMKNDPSVNNVDMDLRKCRFRNEIIPSFFGQTFQIYGYSTCIVSCEREIMYKRCHCVHHLMEVPNPEEFTCNYTGLGCLAEYETERRMSGPDVESCKHCIPSCEEIELSNVILLEPMETEEDDDDDDDDEEEEDFRINIIMTSLPSIQYKRRVVRTKLDLVVSIGGLAALFFGASLLSLVEAVYFLFIRSGVHRT